MIAVRFTIAHGGGGAELNYGIKDKHLLPILCQKESIWKFSNS